MENVVVLSGGIGNQLFQIAAGYSYFGSFIVYDKSLLNYKTKRKTINGILLPQFKSMKRNVIFDLIIKSKLTYKLNLPFFWKDYSYFINCKFLTGYFQDVSKHKNSIFNVAKIVHEYNEKKIFDLKYRLDIQLFKTIAVHLRFGDYLNDDIFYVVDLEYIKKAFSHFTDIETIYIFCDDEIPNDIKLYLDELESTVIYISKFALTDSEEFLLLSVFSNVIISNSTFSFWSVLINPNQGNKIVYCPKKYFNNKNNSQWINNCQEMGFKLI